MEKTLEESTVRDALADQIRLSLALISLVPRSAGIQALDCN